MFATGGSGESRTILSADYASARRSKPVPSNNHGGLDMQYAKSVNIECLLPAVYVTQGSE